MLDYVGLEIFLICVLFTENKLKCTYTFLYVQDILRYLCLWTSLLPGRPATNVTWTRGNDENNVLPVSDNAQVTVLEDAVTAQYSHSLNVTGTDLSAVYGCSVSNNKLSSAKAIALNGMISTNAQAFPNNTCHRVR